MLTEMRIKKKDLEGNIWLKYFTKKLRKNSYLRKTLGKFGSREISIRKKISGENFSH